eukprot:2992801-Amphidinium_carterae.1
MTSATAVVRTETSLKKRTGKPLDDSHRTLDYFAIFMSFITVDAALILTVDFLFSCIVSQDLCVTISQREK